MTNSLYANSSTEVVCTAGGAQSVDGAAAATQLSSTAIPCRVVELSTTSANDIHWNVASTNVSLGALIPTDGSVRIGIDDVSKIWVYASTAGSVFCTYMG